MVKDAPTILQVVPELDTGGAELSTIEVAEAIVRSGGRALVASAGGRLVADVVAVGAAHMELPLASKNPLTLYANAGRLKSLIEGQSVDLVHARSRAPAWSALSAARQCGVPFVTTYHGAYSENGPVKRAYNRIMARGDVVIANSRYTANLIKERYATPDARICVINRGVDLEAFDPIVVSPERVAAWRASLDLTDSDQVVLHPARLTRWKGQSVVIEAARLLKVRGRLDNLVFVFAGEDQGRTEYTAELRSLVSAAGLEPHVRFAGHVGDMPTAFAASAIAIVASTEPEAFGRTAAEAQAMGVPVIATALGAPQETVLAPPAVAADMSTGRLVPPGEPAALADAVWQLMFIDDAGRQALAERARAHVQRNFSKEQLQLATLGVYDRLLGSALADRFAT